MIVLNTGDYLQARLSSAVSGGMKTVSLNAGGSGYTPGTVALTVGGGTGGTLSATASAGGVITSIDSITAEGTGYAVAAGVATTAGAGSGCTVDITSIYQPSYVCSYVDTDDTPGRSHGFLSGTTSVVILTAPVEGSRMLDMGIIFNSDKASVIPIVEFVSGGNTIEVLPRNALAVNKSVEFGRQRNQELSLDDTPVNGETNEGITSNWAYDHNAAETGVHGAGANDLVNTGDFGANVGTFLATPSSANLAAAVTDETGSGVLVFATSPTLVTPTIGVATATSVNKVAITAPASSATLTIADGQTLTCETNSLVNQDLTTDASPTFGGLTKVGGADNYLSVGATGLITMAGTGIGKLNLRPSIVQSRAKISDNKPTEVTRGCNVGHSFPIYNSDGEELFFRMRIPARWDGTTDPQFGVLCTLTGAEDIGDKFRFQLEWQTTVCGGTAVMGTTTSSCVSEQTIISGGTDAHTGYCLWFTMDADDGTNPIAVGEMLQGRLRRIAASSSEVTAEIAVWDWTTTWAVNKMYPVWVVDENVS